MKWDSFLIGVLVGALLLGNEHSAEIATGISVVIVSGVIVAALVMVLAWIVWLPVSWSVNKYREHQCTRRKRRSWQMHV